MSYMTYDYNPFQEFAYLAPQWYPDLNVLNCLNLRDTNDCANCLATMQTGDPITGKLLQHFVGDMDAMKAVCSQPYKGLNPFVEAGFTWPYDDFPDAASRYGNLVRRQCNTMEHRHINNCLNVASGVSPVSDDACLQCIPGLITGPQQVGQPRVDLVDPWPSYVLPACVPIADDLLAAVNSRYSRTPGWVNLEPIPDNFMEQIIRGCGANNATYQDAFVYDTNRHNCTDRYKVNVPCNEVDLKDFSESEVNCDKLASTTSTRDAPGPEVEYRLCTRGPTLDSCVEKTNEDGSVATCNNHLKKCTRDEWLAVGISNPQIDPSDIWCYASPPSPDTCSRSFNPSNCPTGTYPLSHFPAFEGHDPLCLPLGGCNAANCCAPPKCSYDFDSSRCPSGSTVPDRWLNRNCRTSPCTPEECCDAPH